MISVKKSYIPYIVGFMCLAVGAAAGSFITRNVLFGKEKDLLNQVKPVRIQNNKYHFINPLLGYSIPDAAEFFEFKPLETKINATITSSKQNGGVSDISVYFRDLNLGHWMGINENEKYDPASMLKVVIMIAYYKEAETNPGVLSQPITYTAQIDSLIGQVPNQTTSTLQIGKQYTAEQLIEYMIINSDNGAKNALLENIDNNSLNEIYTDLGVEIPPDNGNYTISAKSYTLFFRVLYNSTYLNKNYSEQALSLLNKAQYSDGLIAGLPKNVEVSHKFGEHVETDSSGNITLLELHDCGIIFHPDRPYVLCVMTRGNNLTKLQNAIQTISKQVYESVDSDYK